MARPSHEASGNLTRPMHRAFLLVLTLATLFVSVLAAAALVETEDVIPVAFASVSAPSLRASSGEASLIDDFAIRAVSQETWHAIATDGRSRADFVIEPRDGRAGYHLIADLVRPAEPEAADVAGVAVRVAGGRGRDWSAFGAIAMRVQGTPGTYLVQLGSARVADHDHFNAYVQLDGSWQEIVLSLDAFRQEGFGEPVVWTGRDIVHVGLFSVLPGPATLMVEHVALSR